LLLKDGENGAGSVTVLELGDEWMVKQILFCTFFICFQRIIED